MDKSNKIKFDKVFEENPELQKNALDLAFHVMPSIIESLLLSDKIDRNRTDDMEYIASVVLEHLDVVDSLQHSSRIDDQLIETAREAALAGKIPVVVILIATTLEHIINLFYRETLEKGFGLSSDEATEAIRSNFQTKLGWLMQIVSENGLSDELRKRVKQITDLRNAFVHYKAIGVSLNEPDSLETLINQVNNIGIDIILNTPDELESELSKKYEALFPEIELSHQITEALALFIQQKYSS